jgi:non-homologous end joining protein Ku
VMALEAYDKGLLGTTLYYPYEVRQATDFRFTCSRTGPKVRLDASSALVKAVTPTPKAAGSGWLPVMDENANRALERQRLIC